MGLVFGSTDLCVIFQSQAGIWIHPPIFPPSHAHPHSSSQTSFHPRIRLSAHLTLHPSRAHTSIHPPVHPVCTHIHPASCPSIYPTTHPFICPSIQPHILPTPLPYSFSSIFLKLFASLCKSTSIYTLFSSPSIHLHICSYMYSSIIQPSIIHISFHHFICLFFLASMYTPIYANVNPLFPHLSCLANLKKGRRLSYSSAEAF